MAFAGREIDIAPKLRKRTIEGLTVFGVLLRVLPKRFTEYVLSRRLSGHGAMPQGGG